MIKIPEKKLVFKFSRSSGPGGQNVNKTNTRVTLLLDVANCKSFSDTQKKLILERFAGRADSQGVVRVISQKCRTQKANRDAAVRRLNELLEKALHTYPVRKKTAAPRRAIEKRLEEKRNRSALKRQRAGNMQIENGR